jgi:hypothetical protein
MPTFIFKKACLCVKTWGKCQNANIYFTKKAFLCLKIVKMEFVVFGFA